MKHLPVVAIVLTVLSCGQFADASLLTFEPANFTGPGGTISQSYGDTATVNVSYTQSGGTGLFPWTVSFGDLVNVGYWNTANNVMEIKFEAIAGYNVVLHSFQMSGWPNFDRQIASVRVLDGGNNILFNQSPALIEGINAGIPTHSTFSFAPLVASTLVIRMDATGSSTLVGIDNISYDTQAQVTPTPEPTSLALLGLASVGGIALRWRQRRKTLEAQSAA